MDEDDFEGTVVLEQLAAIGRFDEFLEAIDADDRGRVVRLMKRANLGAAAITAVLEKIEAADGEH